MVRYRSIILGFALIFILACGTLAPAPTDSPTALPPTVEPTSAPPQLSLDQIKNAQYKLSGRDDHAIVQLTDGVYQNGEVGAADFARVFLTENVVLGDLNGDGANEAAAVVFENFGGSGSFGYVVVYGLSNGQPIFITSELIDDRPQINSMAIENGEIFLDATTHGANDPMCCPTLQTTRRYALVNHQLRIVHYATNTPDGKKREIEITSPSEGAEANASVQVDGNVSVAPFENNLSYFIYGADNQQYASGPIMVQAPDFGAPGTFSQNISLEGIPSGTTVYLEVQDISAADGSWLAMSAVKLQIK
ncbi:MAG: hypothetical protein LC099_04900 [Anaerolineales bacterium]|nr:hypothetical protein [Anaerolineales bacterium]